MKARTAVGIAVASALSWSYGAWANSGYADAHAGTSFGAVAPYSPNEAGPAAWPDERDLALDAYEIRTPLASNEAGMSQPFAADEPARSVEFAQGTLPNPQTPWSPNEAGFDTYAEDMDAYEQQRTELEQARIAAAEWNGRLASEERTAVVGSTAGTTFHGSSGDFGTAGVPTLSTGPESANEAGMPSPSERTAMIGQESEHGLAVEAQPTVGVLEIPARVTEYTVWSVEPLTPDADLTRGDTVYLSPESSEPVLMLGSRPHEANDVEQSAAIRDSETGSPSL